MHSTNTVDILRSGKYFLSKSMLNLSVWQAFTCKRQHLETPHSAEMRQAEVSDLAAPPQVESVEVHHGGDVADSDVRDVNAPETEIRHWFWRFCTPKVESPYLTRKPGTLREQNLI